MKTVILLALLLSACGPSASDTGKNARRTEQDPEAEFTKTTRNDSWANWPTDMRYFSGDELACVRATDQYRNRAIDLLAQSTAIRINGKTYKELTGRDATLSKGELYLLRGFSTTNSAARVTVNGDIVTVHSDALGGVYNIRRDPCVAVLKSAPSTVYTAIAYDL